MSWSLGKECSQLFPGVATDREVQLLCVKRASPMGSVCGNATLSVSFVRHYFLHVSSHLRHLRHYLGWSRMKGIVREADAIIVNRGSHFTPDKDFQAGVRAFLRYLRAAAPNTLIMARSTYPGHVNCTAFTKPLEAPPILDESAPHTWSRIPPQNPIVKREVHSIGGVYVDVAPMTALRADGKMGGVDCLHYCIPGPVDGWVQLILNTLLQLLPRHGQE